MVKKEYVPDRGDLVWLNFTPQAGHEQVGKRPALILSPRAYNKKVHLALVCPITSTEKGYPFEVRIEGRKVKGSVLSDQVKSLDWTVRDIGYIEKCDTEAFEQVLENIKALIVGAE